MIGNNHRDIVPMLEYDYCSSLINPKKTSLGILYARTDTSEASEAWETTVLDKKTLKRLEN